VGVPDSHTQKIVQDAPERLSLAASFAAPDTE
jgi:hypothetical protein